MSLENKSLAELEELASMERTELEDVEGWIKLRRMEAKPGPRSDDDVKF